MSFELRGSHSSACTNLKRRLSDLISSQLPLQMTLQRLG